ncbi:2-aminoethylphosphonate--pyruvate transaminase [Paenibacillus sp. N1-5-1-14]|uniref:2-aminoethylphosphonate--pyruvate transaminase n=1 Tax=Paenibacillus radicibacter TaxID=2972488 RepID=UPI002158A83B|nr:2-aminoethylphosphonate--pyruvate transaminase [Paenibacillus radicibacter]MCR8643074.1 2-aminoethylphosphonate--pyruvate transaminase [Paenibacillus radicibacter]
MITAIRQDNPYVLLTPGPLSTTPTVKGAMMRDWCTWDDDYNNLVQEVRQKLVSLATPQTDDYTAVLMQGSGSFSVESVIGSVIPKTGKLLVLVNGAYGQRIAQMAEVLGIATTVVHFGEVSPATCEDLEATLEADTSITHVAFVHCETTTGILNPLAALSEVVKRHDKVLIVDAMSSFGGVQMDVTELGIDFLISSANKCIQGVPGFGFIVAKRTSLEVCAGQARSVSLDLYDQWATMEKQGGKWRFTSPTHVVRAFHQALIELEEEGGIAAREERYTLNQRILVEVMEGLGLQTLLTRDVQSPIITAFRYPDSSNFTFKELYNRLKEEGFVIYPGKISAADTFRIGNIGDVHPADMERLVEVIARNRFWV